MYSLHRPHRPLTVRPDDGIVVAGIQFASSGPDTLGPHFHRGSVERGPMRPLEKRVEALETRVTKLEQLPARMDRLEFQIVQLRAEMRDEFSATRAEFREEMRAGDQEVIATLRGEIREAGTMIVTTLMEQIEQSRRETRVLFEESLARLATIHEHFDTRRKRRR